MFSLILWFVALFVAQNQNRQDIQDWFIDNFAFINENIGKLSQIVLDWSGG